MLNRASSTFRLSCNGPFLLVSTIQTIEVPARSYYTYRRFALGIATTANGDLDREYVQLDAHSRTLPAIQGARKKFVATIRFR